MPFSNDQLLEISRKIFSSTQVSDKVEYLIIPTDFNDKIIDMMRKSPYWRDEEKTIYIDGDVKLTHNQLLPNNTMLLGYKSGKFKAITFKTKEK